MLVAREVLRLIMEPSSGRQCRLRLRRHCPQADRSQCRRRSVGRGGCRGNPELHRCRPVLLAIAGKAMAQAASPVHNPVELGRGTCRESVCQSVEIALGAEYLKKKYTKSRT